MKRFLLLVFLLVTAVAATATHLRGGYISVKRVSGLGSKSCDITIKVFTDTNCSQCILFGGEMAVLNFGDGSTMTVPEVQNSPLAGYNNVGIAQFTVRHTFPVLGQYTISFQEPNRNGGVLNMENSLTTLFYIETMVDLSFVEFSSTPEFLMPPIFQGNLASNLSLSAGATSDADLILLYTFGTPGQDRNVPVVNYQLPESIKINPFNGLITWDTEFNDEFVMGEFTFNVRVSSFREIDGVFYRVSTVSRDIQIILDDQPFNFVISTDTDFDENSRVYIPSNESKEIKFFFEKLDESSIEVSAESELELTPSAYSFTTYDSSTLPNIKVGLLTLTSVPEILRENPYLITIRGKEGQFAKDVSILFFTQDVQPKMVDYVITGTEKDLKNVQIYPNPSNGVFNFSALENRNLLIKVRDQMGALVFFGNPDQLNRVDLSHLPTGIYFCTISSGSTTKQIKLIRN